MRKYTLQKHILQFISDNTPEETAFDLSKKKTSLMEKSDYANFIMAQALLKAGVSAGFNVYR